MRWDSEVDCKAAEKVVESAAIVEGGEVGWVVRCAAVSVRYGRYCVGSSEEIFVLEHEGGDVGGETLDLFSDVSEEGVAGPATDDHDCVCGDFGKIHCHGCARSEGVCADVGCREA